MKHTWDLRWASRGWMGRPVRLSSLLPDLSYDSPSQTANLGYIIHFLVGYTPGYRSQASLRAVKPRELPLAQMARAAARRVDVHLLVFEGAFWVSVPIEDPKALPGLGDAYAQKIVDNRPYHKKDQLVSTNIIPEATYNKIKDQIIAMQAGPR